MTKKKKYEIVWSETSKKDLKNIFNFIKEKSLQGAKNVVSDIRKSPKDIQFPEQTQIEEYFPSCRRISVKNRDYKVLYQIDEEKNILNVVRVFGTKQHPDRLTSGDF